MAKKRKTRAQQRSKANSGGGALTGMRSGMQRAAGTTKKKRGKNQQPEFFDVFKWVLGFALLLVVIWLITR